MPLPPEFWDDPPPKLVAWAAWEDSESPGGVFLQTVVSHLNACNADLSRMHGIELKPVTLEDVQATFPQRRTK